MATAAVLGLLAFVLVVPVAGALARASWTSHEPRAALVLWQALGLASGLAAVGAMLAVALAPAGDSVPYAVVGWARAVAAGAWDGGLGPAHLVLLVLALVLLGRLLGVLVLSSWRMARHRQRHRQVVDLVGMPCERDRRATVLDHPGVAAYCLPGMRSRVVLTAGTVDLLEDDELDAVLAHERAHVAERHDLVVLPFAAWYAALPWLPGIRMSVPAVQRLVEMVADDRACVGRDRFVVAAALARVGSVRADAAPEGALAVTDTAVLDRVRRLLDEPNPAPVTRKLVYAAATVMATLPAIGVLLPTYF